MSARRSDAWIFISHSNRNIAAVRKIRNALEERGANPILFFLKQRVPDNLLSDFIRREIEARNFFILCRSEAALASPYVQIEVAHVEKLENVKRTVIDLALPWSAQLELIEDLLSDAMAFVSYHAGDRDAVAPFLQHLMDEDLAVFDPAKDAKFGVNLKDAIEAAVSEAGRRGYLIQFLSQRALENPFVVAEFEFFVQMASAEQRPPFLISLEPVGRLRLPPQFMQYQIIDATAVPFPDVCRQISRELDL